MRKTRKIVTRFYVDCPNAQLVPTHVRFMDLLSNYPIGRSLDSSSDEGIALLGVGEVLAMEDFKFPVLLDKSEDADSFVGERGPGDGSHHSCDLRRGYMSWSGTTRRFNVERRTWMITFPGASITS